MADEVTKKDLQALQTKVDKQIEAVGKQNNSAGLTRQIADLDKRIFELRRDMNKGLAEENEITVTVRRDLVKRLDDLERKLGEVEKKGR